MTKTKLHIQETLANGKIIKLGSEKDAEAVVELLLVELGFKPLTEIKRDHSIKRKLGRKIHPIRADIRAFSEKEVVLIVESKKPKESIEDALEQGFSYARNFEKERIIDKVLVHDGFKFKIYKTLGEILLKEFILKDTDLKLINKGQTKKVISKYQIDKIISKEILTKEAKKPESRINFDDFKSLVAFQNERTFDNVINRCANIIFSNDESGEEDILDELLKVLFIKDYEEQRLEEGNKRGDRRIKNRFTIREFDDYIINVDPDSNILKDKLFEELKKKFEKESIFDKEELELNNGTLRAIVGVLEIYNLKDTDMDVKGRVFENLLNKQYKASRGQYLTPKPLVEFMAKISEPLPSQKILDPACGSGRFLIEFYKIAKKVIGERYKGEKKVIEEKIKELKYTHLWGIDIDKRLVRIAKMGMMMHNDGRSHIFKANAIKNHITQELEENSFDLILTNPPFGGDVIEEITEDFKVVKAKGKKSQTAFIEKFAEWCKIDDGYVCTVIDDGILNNPNWKKVRETMLENFEIIGVFSLPRLMFSPYNSAKSSVIYMKRKRKGKEQTEKVFMSIDSEIDDPTVTSEFINYEEIKNVFMKFKGNRKINLKNPNKKYFTVDFSKDNFKNRIDPYYYHPLHQKLGEKFNRNKKYFKPLSKVADLIKQKIQIEANKEYLHLERIDKNGRIFFKKLVGSKLPKGITRTFSPNTVIVSQINAMIKCIGLIPPINDLEIVSTSEYYGYVPKKDGNGKVLITPEYLNIALRSNDSLIQINRFTSGQYERISPTKFNNLIIFSPKVNVQIKISEDIFKERRDAYKMLSKTDNNIKLLDNFSRKFI